MSRRSLFATVAGALLLVLAAPAAVRAGEPRFLGKTQGDWIDRLASENAEVRASAAFALGQIGARTRGVAAVAVGPLPALLALQEIGQPRRAVRALLGALSDRDSAEVREAAAFALAEMGPTVWAGVVEALADALKDDDLRVRRGAAVALGRNGTSAAEVGGSVREALRDRAPEVRQAASWAVARMGPEVGRASVSPLTLLAASERDATARCQAVRSLGEIGKPAAAEAVPVLLTRLRDRQQPQLREAALTALVNTVGPEDRDAVAVLLPLLRSAEKETARGAALALANIGGDESVRAVPLLREALKGGEIAGQRLASAALASIGRRADEALDDLVAVVADRRRDDVVRRNAALALVRLGDKPRKNLRTLLSTLRDERQPEVLMYLIEALYEIADAGASALTATEPAVPTLLRVVKDRRLPWMVRQRAVWKLGQHDLAEVGAVPALEEVLKETSQDERAVRYEAAVRLGIQRGPKVSDRTVKVLLAYLNDPAMRRYAGSEAHVKSAGEGQGQSQVKELGTGDARLAPALALKHIGPKADQPEVIRALESAAESPDKKVSRVAGEALKAIRRE